MKELINIIESMKSDKVSNYVIAGLDSYLLGNGKVRVFKNSRDHQDQITPHSHRYDFTCLVLTGSVQNHIWEKSASGDEFTISKLRYKGAIGEHEKVKVETERFIKTTRLYKEGQTYSMTHEEIHSITFSKGAIVLFFEGPENTESESVILEPLINGQTISTYEKKSFMFLKEGPEKLA